MHAVSLTDCVGGLGAAVIVAAYAALQLRAWTSEQLGYSAANAAGSALILVSLVFDPNWPSMMIESFWLCISLFGLFRAMRRRWSSC